MLKAIPTTYAGVTFRSRLEARWAVFYDTLGIRWFYEHEGYDLNGTWYLPDFWLPQQNCFVEIKPTAPTVEEESKLSALAGVGRKAFLFYGECWYPWEGPDDSAIEYEAFMTEEGELAVAEDYGYRWCICGTCGRLGIEYNGRSDRLPCKEPYMPGEGARIGCPRTGPNRDKGYTYDHPRIVAAYQAARLARFGR